MTQTPPTTPQADKRGWQTWGAVFNYYLSKGHDHGSAAYNADQWEARQK